MATWQPGRGWPLAALAILLPAAAVAGEAAPTFAEQRILDGTYIYLVSPEYCDPAPEPGILRRWIALHLADQGISARIATDYLAASEGRLRMMADAAFTGNRAAELCDAIRATVANTPMPDAGRGGGKE